MYFILMFNNIENKLANNIIGSTPALPLKLKSVRYICIVNCPISSFSVNEVCSLSDIVLGSSNLYLTPRVTNCCGIMILFYLQEQ